MIPVRKTELPICLKDLTYPIFSLNAKLTIMHYNNLIFFISYNAGLRYSNLDCLFFVIKHQGVL